MFILVTSREVQAFCPGKSVVVDNAQKQKTKGE